MTNINDLFQAAEAAEDTGGFADLLTHRELPTGTEVLCEITYCGAKTRPAKDGKGPAKTFNSKLKVIEPGHQYEGGEFFDAIHLSGGDATGKLTDGQLGYNKRLFAKLQGAGLGAAFFGSNPSDEAIAKALVGCKVRVKLKWQAEDAQGRAFLDNTTTWSPVDVASSAGGYVPQGRPSTPSKGF